MVPLLNQHTDVLGSAFHSARGEYSQGRGGGGLGATQKPKSRSQESLHDRAGEPFVALHRRAEPRQRATIQRLALFKETTYLSQSLPRFLASASPSRSMRASMELKSKC